MTSRSGDRGASVSDPGNESEVDEFDADAALAKRVKASPPLVLALAAALPLLILIGEIVVIETLRFRSLVLGMALSLAFLTFDTARRAATIVSRALAGVSIFVTSWIAVSSRSFLFRAAEPTAWDVVLGAALLSAVIAGAWASTGKALPVISMATIAYVLWGGELDRVGLSTIAHRGYDVPRLVGSMAMSFEGVFGVPLDVAATTIGLFAIYGALLEAAGAANFFLDLALVSSAGTRSPRGAGRAVTLAGFLLGSVSGSGVATTFTLGGAAGPTLKRAGFSSERAGALLAAAGIGAILSPPTLGAAAFLIAEFLKISYGQVLLMALVPTLLYYFGVLLMIDADAARIPASAVTTVPVEVMQRTLGEVLRSGGHHLVSPLLIVGLLVSGYSANRAALLATLAAFQHSFRDRGNTLTPRRIGVALVNSGAALVPVIATTACAGILVSGLTLTGLGLKVAGLIVSLAGASPAAVILFSAFAVSVLGLSVPVTASYILAAVTVAPALIQVGVPEVAAHMFIFYYAVLSEVSPPTALSPMAAATLLGGDPYRTMMTTLRYTLPAFLVPLAFTLRPDGLGLLLRAEASSVFTSLLATVAIVFGSSIAASGFLRGPLRPRDRVAFTAAALSLLLLPGSSQIVGIGLMVAAFAMSSGRPSASA
jgi:TRAP transporter 4TM/12TM fusion protein